MKFLVGSILTVLVVVLPPLVTQAVDFEGCSECHKEALDRYRNQRYLHPPFAEEQCGDCHEAEESAPQLGEDSLTSSADRQKIQRLIESEKADITHGFLLPGGKVGETLIIDVHGSNGKVSTQEIAVPRLSALAEVEDSGRPPIISEAQVLKVQRRLLVSATIGWQTDTITNGFVRYGNSDLAQTSEPGPEVGQRHQVVLYNLKTDQTYRYSVVSTDLFGRSKSSAPMEFSTANPDLTPPPSNSDNAIGEEDIGLISSFRRFGNDYLLELTLTQPAWVLVGSNGESQRLDQNRGVPDDEFHADLSSQLTSSLGACLNCHKAHAHPLNVPPGPGMNVLQEYPTLPDGRITCSSCHAPHGSNFYYLTRKHFQRDLCVGCHTDKSETE
jgi:predicted CXXCH cytochrome family protein